MPHAKRMTGSSRDIAPIYGNGWIDSDGATRDVPEPFRISCVAPDAMEGIVLGDHEFAGATAHLVPRHTTPDGLFNVEVRRGAIPLSSGCAAAQPVGR